MNDYCCWFWILGRGGGGRDFGVERYMLLEKVEASPGGGGGGGGGGHMHTTLTEE